jgi:shikimate kinase
MLTLVGLPGSGKSAIGKRLAGLMSVPFWDVDTVVEEILGCTIAHFFITEGEARFRDIESQVLNELSFVNKGVLSTGGGSVLRELNRDRMRQRGDVIYLHTEPLDLFHRLQHDTKRPLLQVQDKLARLTELYTDRDPLYRLTAHHIVESATHRAATITAILTQLQSLKLESLE